MNTSNIISALSQSKLPFYTCTDNDRSAYLLYELGKTDLDGKITDEGVSDIDPSLYELGYQDLENIQKLSDDKFTIAGRCVSIPMEITTSMAEMISEIDLAAQQNFNQRPKIILDGGNLLRQLGNSIIRILVSWASVHSTTNSLGQAQDVNAVIAQLFKTRLKSKANDTDWQICLNLETIDDSIKIIEKGIVAPLAEKLKEKKINPYHLVLELAKTKKYAENKPNPYLKGLFENDSLPDYEDPTLHSHFIKAFAFNSAADICSRSKSFSIRSLGAQGKIHDYLFPIKARSTIIFFNSLFVNLTGFYQKDFKAKFSLESFFGPSKTNVMQAIVDCNLSNYTIGSTGKADFLDFFKTISHLTQGGRVYKQGWLDEIFSALLKEQKIQEIPLSDLLYKQLISSSVKHHGGQLSTLVVLTFITSTILLRRDHGYHKDIQKLWQCIISYIDKRQGASLQPNPNALIEQMKMLLRDPNFLFIDLLAIIQTTSALMQHSDNCQKGIYQCNPTQTGHEIFLQIQLNLSTNIEKEESPFDVCTLFFPYDLPKAIQHLASVDPVTQVHLHRIQDILISEHQLAYSLDKSPLHKYNTDPRLHLNECMSEALKLLKIKDARVWKTGFLLCLALLAQKKEEIFHETLVRSLISMLLGSWAPEELKKDVIQTFEKMLVQSKVLKNTASLRTFKKPDIVRWLFTVKEKMFFELAWEYLDAFEEKENYPLNVSLYRNILNDCIPTGDRKIAKLPLIHLVERLATPQIFLPETVFEWMIELYNEKAVIEIDDIEKAIFTVVLNTLQRIKNSAATIKGLPELILKVMKMKTRPDMTLQCFRLGNEVQRLRIFTDTQSEKQFQECLKNILLVTGNTQDINLTAAIDKFDFSSSYEIKNAIENRLQLRQNLVHFSKNDKDVLLHLLERWIQTESIKKNPEEFFTIIKAVAKAVSASEITTEIHRLLELFLKEQISSQMLLEEYLKEKDPLLMPMLLEDIFQMLCKPQEYYTKEHYQSGTEYLLQAIHLKQTRQRIQKLPIFVYLQQLHALGLAEEVVKIYAAIPQVQDRDTIESRLILVHACSKQTFETKSLESGNIIEELLTEICLSEIKDSKVMAELKNLYTHFLVRQMTKGDFLTATSWLKKLIMPNVVLDRSFYEYAFELLLQLAQNGQIREVESLAAELNPPVGFGLSWLNIYKVLLKGGHITASLNLLNNTHALKSTHNEFQDQWTEILEEMLLQTSVLSKSSDNASRAQLDILFNIIHKLIFQNNPTKIVTWTNYFIIAAGSAPLSVLEEILYALTNPKLCPSILTRPMKSLCVMYIIESLSKQGSTIFFNMAHWWPVIWEMIATGTQDQQLNFINITLEGTAKAIDVQELKLVEGSVSQNSKAAQMMVKGTNEFVKILDSEVIVPLRTTIGFYQWKNLVKILLKTKTVDNKGRAMAGLLNHNHFDPIDDQLTMQLFNDCLKEMRTCKDERAQKAAIILIDFMQQSNHHVDSNHYAILKYLQTVFPLDLEKEAAQFLDKNSNRIVTMFGELCIYTKIIDKAIRGILENPWQREISEEEKKLMKWAFERMSNSYSEMSWMVIEWSLGQKDLERYLNKSGVRRLQAHMNLLKSNWYLKTKMKVSQVALEIVHALRTARTRLEVMTQNGNGNRFRYLDREVHIAKRTGVQVFLAVGIIVCIVAIIFNKIWIKPSK